MRKVALSILLALCLGACGYKGPLTPPQAALPAQVHQAGQPALPPQAARAKAMHPAA